MRCQPIKGVNYEKTFSNLSFYGYRKPCVYRRINQPNDSQPKQLFRLELRKETDTRNR